MPVHTNSQKMAQMAYQRITDRRPSREFASLARSFPSLVHSCGLAQAVAFAKAKQHEQNGTRLGEQYLEDLAAVLLAVGHAEGGSVASLDEATRGHPVPAYVRLSRNTLLAAGWLKRYVEAVEQE